MISQPQVHIMQVTGGKLETSYGGFSFDYFKES